MTAQPSVDPAGELGESRGAHGPVLYVVHLLIAGDVDGIGLHVLDLARAQLDSGRVSPLVVTRPSARYAQRLFDAGIPIHRLPSVRLASTLLRRPIDGLLRAPYDLVHVHGHRASQLLLAAGALAHRHPRGPVVTTCHGFVPTGWRRRFRVRTELSSYARSRIVLATSRELAAEVVARTEHPRVAYVPNGVAVDARPGELEVAALLARLGVPTGAPLVGTVGRLANEKRQDVFLRAARTIADELPAVRFLLVGDGPERVRLERLMHDLGLAGRVHFTGYVERVPVLCSALSLMLHTSDHEGTPRAVIEGMAVGVPVVATAVGGVPEIVEHGRTGVVVPRGSADLIARAALDLLGDRETMAAMGAHGRARVEAEFTAAAMAARVERLYRSYVVPAEAGPR